MPPPASLLATGQVATATAAPQAREGWTTVAEVPPVPTFYVSPLTSSFPSWRDPSGDLPPIRGGGVLISRTRRCLVCWRVCSWPSSFPTSSPTKLAPPSSLFAFVFVLLRVLLVWSLTCASQIDMETLMELTEEELAKLGLDRLGPRNKLFSHIQHLKLAFPRTSRLATTTFALSFDRSNKADFACVMRWCVRASRGAVHA